MSHLTEAQQDLRRQLNSETAKIAWTDLQSHFARGVVFAVATNMDLVEVAAYLAEDQQEQAQTWQAAGQLATVSDEQAQQWFDEQQVLWAVVVKPWILVQPIE